MDAAGEFLTNLTDLAASGLRTVSYRRNPLLCCLLDS